MADTSAWVLVGNLKGPKGDPGEGAAIATPDKAGIVKPGDAFDIAADGTLSLYQKIAITSFTGGSDHEIGETVDTAQLAWTLSKTPTRLTLDGKDIAKGSDGTWPAGQPLTGLGLKANKIWTLKAVDARGAEASRTTSVLFHYKRYWGVGDKDGDAIDSAFLLSLEGSELGDSKTRTFTVTAGEGQYIYYAIPASFGTPAFYVGGFEGGLDLARTFDHVNASGATVSYNVFKSTNAGLGKTSVEAR